MLKQKKNAVIIYQTKSGAIMLRGDTARETVWATQAQIATAFDIDVRTINEHIKNVYKTKELIKRVTFRNFRIVQKEGQREVEREVKHYNLDLILSVGYRVNSKKATLFRQWATKTLRRYITDGYAINKSRIAKNYGQFLEAVEQIKTLLPEDGRVDAQSALELIRAFADTRIFLRTETASS